MHPDKLAEIRAGKSEHGFTTSYRPPDGITPKEVATLLREKLKPQDTVVMMKTKDLWPHRDYTRTAEHGKLGRAEWDALKSSLKARGWDKDNPAHLDAGKGGSLRLGEGNHRLALAREAGIERVPVIIHARSDTVIPERKNPSSEHFEGTRKEATGHGPVETGVHGGKFYHTVTGAKVYVSDAEMDNLFGLMGI